MCATADGWGVAITAKFELFKDTGGQFLLVGCRTLCWVGWVPRHLAVDSMGEVAATRLVSVLEGRDVPGVALGPALAVRASSESGDSVDSPPSRIGVCHATKSSQSVAR